MKASAIITLAFLLVLGPVAWTVEACLDGHHRHAFFEPTSAQDDEHDADATLPALHCAVWDQPFGAALRSAPVEVTRSDTATSIDIVSTHGIIPTPTVSNLWLEALFKRFSSSAFTKPLSRHLVLSVLRI